jgi:cytochrome c553
MSRRPFPTLLGAALGALVAAEARAAGDRELGQYLSSECVTCHQLSGKATGGVPPIVAWPEDQFIAVLHAYKTRERDNAAMQAIAARLSEEDIAALAAYFGSLPSQSAAQ